VLIAVERAIGESRSHPPTIVAVAPGENLVEKQLDRGWAKRIDMTSSVQIKVCSEVDSKD
jgi:hypothetical protein